MLLEEENAVIYGGRGKVGGAVARAGAGVFLDGRTLASLVEMPLESGRRGLKAPTVTRWRPPAASAASHPGP